MIKVTIKYCEVLNKWYVVHAKSGQNAFSNDVNGFVTEQDALIFAKDNSCEVFNET
jgi:hypothetical protein